jgi:hypothetical protein
MDWTNYLRQKLREQEDAAANEERARRARQDHFTRITTAAWEMLREACSANGISSGYREEAGHNFWLGDYRFRMHLVGDHHAMHIASYAYLERPAEQKTLEPVANDQGDTEILALAADDICRYLLDQYLRLRDSKR